MTLRSSLILRRVAGLLLLAGCGADTATEPVCEWLVRSVEFGATLSAPAAAGASATLELAEVGPTEGPRRLSVTWRLTPAQSVTGFASATLDTVGADVTLLTLPPPGVHADHSPAPLSSAVWAALVSGRGRLVLRDSSAVAISEGGLQVRNGTGELVPGCI